MTPHARLVIGGTFDAETNTNSDIENTRRYERLGVEDVRLLKEVIYRRSSTGVKERIVRIEAQFVTHEAQNALLKILEEPPRDTTLELVIPEGLQLLPTVLSRFVVIEYDVAKKTNEVFQNFLASPYKDRLSYIETVTKQKDNAAISDMKQGLIGYLQSTVTDLDSLTELEYTMRLLGTRGASNKMLLDNLALLLPVRS